MDKTTIPDDTFETYLESLGFGDDLANNNLVYTHRFTNIAYLFLSSLQTIESLEGINELSRLKDLRFENNSVSEVDLSSNSMLERLFCRFNPLIQLDVSNNILLKDLVCGSTSITSLNLANNILLQRLDCSLTMIPSLDVSNNINLEFLYGISGQLTSVNIDGLANLRTVDLSYNQISTLDLSNNSQLRNINVGNNSLTMLNLKNGNNASIIFMNATFNNLLNCIDVDDESAANNGESPYTIPPWYVEPGAIFSENCSLGVDEKRVIDSILLFPNPVESVLHIQVQNNISINTVFLYEMGGRLIYQNTENVNQIDMETLNKGLYFVKIETSNGSFAKKIIKE
jgi:Leucine-rich repeat (LRR) protein